MSPNVTHERPPSSEGQATRAGRGSVPPGPSDHAAAQRGAGRRGLLGILVVLAVLAGNLLFVPLSALLVLAWARITETPWAALGFRRPSSWRALAVTATIAILLGGVFKLVTKAVVLPLLGAPPVNPAYTHLAGNTAAIPGMLFLIVVGAGFGEETVYRGFLFERLRTILGTGRAALALTVVATAVLFGLAHYPEQGLPGAQQATLVGLVFGTVFGRTRTLAPVMAAHVGFDLTALALIYWQWETAVASFLIR